MLGLKRSPILCIQTMKRPFYLGLEYLDVRITDIELLFQLWLTNSVTADRRYET